METLNLVRKENYLTEINMEESIEITGGNPVVIWIGARVILGAFGLGMFSSKEANPAPSGGSGGGGLGYGEFYSSSSDAA